MEENKLQRELFQSILRIKKAMSRPLALGSLPKGTFVVLYAILENGKKLDFVHDEKLVGITVSDLSDILQVSRPAISRTINELENKGFVKRVSTKSDRRLVYVCIAPSGEAALHTAWKRANEGLNAVIEQMGEQDVRELIRILDKLHSVVYDISNTCESEKGIDAYDETKKVL